MPDISPPYTDTGLDLMYVGPCFAYIVSVTAPSVIRMDYAQISHVALTLLLCCLSDPTADKMHYPRIRRYGSPLNFSSSSSMRACLALLTAVGAVEGFVAPSRCAWCMVLSLRHL